MNNLRVLTDLVGGDWVRRVHWMADRPEAIEQRRAELPDYAQVRRYKDSLHLEHLEASFPARGVFRMPIPGEMRGEWTLAVWWIGKQRVSQAMQEAGVQFALVTGREPRYALIGQIPPRAEEFVEAHGITLIQAHWVPVGFLVVTAGGMVTGLSKFTVVSNEAQ